MSTSQPELATKIVSWGGTAVVGRELHSEDLTAITRDVPLARGLGRSYGDASLPPPDELRVAGTRLADRVLAFDTATGVVRAEAGLALQTLNRLFLGRGFYSPVTPGTQYISLGGMVAADVHGKNHHASGSTGAHLRSLRLRVGDGRIVGCSLDRESELFRATIGGMGLTGHVLEVELQLEAIPSPWILSESLRIDDIDHFVAELKASASDWPYTMGWIDCVSRGRRMGRGILNRGRWARPEEAPARLPTPLQRPDFPVQMPGWVLSRPFVRVLNEGLYRVHVPKRKRGIRHPETFFYPLDAIGHWNRLYGRRGFTQYQCVLPDEAGPGAARRLLELLTRKGRASPLCVIKDCGPQGVGTLSFPLRGISVAIDFAIRADTQSIIDDLNEHVIGEGGRVYLAKDLFTRAEHLRRMDQRLETWLAVRDKWDPQHRLRSAQSVRLLGDRSS